MSAVSKFKKIFTYIFHPKALILREKLRKLDKNSKKYSDEFYIQRRYELIFNKKINLDNPQTFNEKMNWLKINNRNENFCLMVDKLEAKSIVRNIVPNCNVANTLGVYTKYSDIDFNALPDSFVIKTTHDCGGVIVVKNKKNFDKKSCSKKINLHLGTNYYWHCREWPYKDLKPRIMIEEFIESESDVLPVYKFFCFHGEPKIVQVISDDKTTRETIDYFDIEWNLLKLRQNYPNSKVHLCKPRKLNEMIEICKKLSAGIPFVRIDLYYCRNEIYFSEFTFFSDAGFAKFIPESWDLELGKLININ